MSITVISSRKNQTIFPRRFTETISEVLKAIAVLQDHAARQAGPICTMRAVPNDPPHLPYSFPSTESALFVTGCHSLKEPDFDWNIENSVPSMKISVFMDGKGKQTGFSVLSEDPERSEECQWLSVCQDACSFAARASYSYAERRCIRVVWGVESGSVNHVR